MDGHDDAQERLTDALDDILERRVVIEQAKGMLMLVYGITAETAFKLLRWRSQETNTKLQPMCAQLVHELSNRGPRHDELKRDLDRILVSVHTRVPSAGNVGRA